MTQTTKRPHGRPVAAVYIIEETTRELRINPSDLYGDGRHFRVCLARGLATLIMRELTVLSFPEIAERLNRPNHSSVITAMKRVKRQINTGEPVGANGDFVNPSESYERIVSAALARHGAELAAA